MVICQTKELHESLPLSLLLKNIQLSNLILPSHATAFQYIQKKNQLIFHGYWFQNVELTNILFFTTCYTITAEICTKIYEKVKCLLLK
jgi:hypothetical protein